MATMRSEKLRRNRRIGQLVLKKVDRGQVGQVEESQLVQVQVERVERGDIGSMLLRTARVILKSGM